MPGGARGRSGARGPGRTPPTASSAVRSGSGPVPGEETDDRVCPLQQDVTCAPRSWFEASDDSRVCSAGAGGRPRGLSASAASGLRGTGRAGLKAVTCRPRARRGQGGCGHRGPGRGLGLSPARTSPWASARPRCWARGGACVDRPRRRLPRPAAGLGHCPQEPRVEATWAGAPCSLRSP